MSDVVKWVFVGWLVLASLLTIVMVGKPRKPSTGLEAAVTVLILAVEVVAILAYWGTP